MKLLLICLFLIFCTCPSSKALRGVDTFEFGQNVGQIAFTTSGSFGLLERVKRVSVIIPECLELKYVRVDVNNRLGPPSVKFDWATNSVIMEYSPLQYSVSQYTIIGKAVMGRYCNSKSAQQVQEVEFVELVAQNV